MPLATPKRDRVLWLGDPCPLEFNQACRDRDLCVLGTEAEHCSQHWAGARAIVFYRPDEDLQQAMASRLIAEAHCHGLYVQAVAAPADVVTLNGRFAGTGLTSWAAEGLLRVAEEIARHDPKHGFDAVRLSGCEKCCSEDQILLRRAFGDCQEVEFRDLTRDHRCIFQAFARLKASVAGPYPLPFLVKLEKRKRAVRELGGYAAGTTHFIPFHARPNLDQARCLLGPTRGLIVANFVENAEPLRELVQRGTAQAAINSLFEDALRGWRTWNARENLGSMAPEGAIKTFSEIHRERAEDRAAEARAFGATMSAAQLASLIDGLPPIRHKVAFSHGDLHGDNVHVRANQAILIDFLNASSKPMADDPAALETSLALAFLAPLNDWRTVLDELYALSNLMTLPDLRPPLGPLANLWNAVRQVRRFGLADQVGSGEYARSVALHLLRHALRKPNRDAPAERRAIMLLHAERIATALRG